MAKRRPKIFPLIPTNLTHVVTSDGVDLAGIVLEPKGRKKAALIWVHGLTSSFVNGQELMSKLSRACTRRGIGYFKFDTRGHDLADWGPRPGTFVGSSHEKFTDSVKDIQAVIQLVKKHGYRQIILAGHSTGAQKVLYYASKMPDRSIKALLLAGPASDVAGELKKMSARTLLYRVNEAKRRAKLHPDELVPPSWGPWSNQRFVSLMTPGSVEETFPYHRLGGRWTALKKVRVPILLISGGDDEYLDRKAERLMDLYRIKAVHSRAVTTRVIQEASHGFTKHQPQLVAAIMRWLSTITL